MARNLRPDGSGGRMSLREHLRELRRRVLLAALGIALGAIAGWFGFDPVFRALQAPLLESASARDAMASVNFGGLASAFDVRLKTATFLGVLASSPWWLYQLWAFITPGLTRRERGWAIGFVGAAAPLFLGGAAMAWSVLPNAVRVLTDFIPAQATNLIDAQTYLSFVMRFILAFGIAFVTPVVMVFLTFTGLVHGRTWAGGWRWAVLGAFVFSAVMTPTPDAITMILMALPICGLYGVAVAVCLLHDRRARRSDAQAPGARVGEEAGTQ